MTEQGSRLTSAEPVGPALLARLRRDRTTARAELRTLTPEDVARACLELGPSVRAELLLACDRPELVVPLLPEAELVHTIRATGMSEAAWLLEIATPEQRVACFDLDAWTGDAVDLPRAREWADALIEAGRDTLVRGFEEMDLELWLALMRSETEIAIVGRDEEPPTGHLTVDGMVYWRIDEERSPHRIREIAEALFERNPQLYWRLVYGMLFESQAEIEEYALRWRTSRLGDLGFPDREQAMRVYRPLAVERVPRVAETESTSAVEPRARLPRELRGTLVAEALAELPGPRAGDLLGYILAVANSIAVADGLPLSDPESIPHALDKAVQGIDAGLRELARLRGEAPHVVLDTTVPLDLFRAGATMDPQLRRRDR